MDVQRTEAYSVHRILHNDATEPSSVQMMLNCAPRHAGFAAIAREKSGGNGNTRQPGEAEECNRVDAIHSRGSFCAPCALRN